VKRSILVLLLVLALGVGYGARYAQQLLERADRPVVVPQQRMSELIKGSCPKRLAEESVEISLIKAVFDDPSTAFPDLQVKILKDIGGGCAFEYVVSGDSYLQGQAVARFDKGSIVKGVDFFNRLDARLMDSDAPSFSVFFFRDENRAYVFETLRRKLYATKGKQAIPVGIGLPQR